MRERKGLAAPVPEAVPAAPPPPARSRATAIAAAVPDQRAGAIVLVVGASSWPLMGSRLLVGRTEGGVGADVELDDDSVSRRHAEFVVSDGAWLLRDLGSTNGTWVGEWRLPPGEAAEVVPGSTVRVGNVTGSMRG